MTDVGPVPPSSSNYTLCPDSDDSHVAKGSFVLLRVFGICHQDTYKISDSLLPTPQLLLIALRRVRPSNRSSQFLPLLSAHTLTARIDVIFCDIGLGDSSPGHGPL